MNVEVLKSDIANTWIFSSENLKKLQSIMYEHYYPKGSHLYWEGDQAGHYFYIVKGAVSLSKTTDDGENLELYHFAPGDLFGDMADETSSQYKLTALSLTDCRLGVIQQKDLESLLWQNGELAIEFVRWMAFTHRSTQLKLRDLLFFGKLGALASTLIRLANTYGLKEHSTIKIGIKITNSSLAGMIGATRETVNRMISKLRKDNILQMENGYITILKINELKEICHCEDCAITLCRL